MKTDDNDISEREDGTSRKRPLWPWFVGGFLAVFVGMSLMVKMFSISLVVCC